MQIMHSKQKYLFVFVFGALAVSAIGLGEGAIKLTPFAPTVKKADNSNITLSCGAPVFSSATSQVYTLPNFTVNGSDEIANISIMVLTGSITATANSAFTIYSDFLASSTAAHKTQILAFSSLQTASAVSDFVRQYITFDSSANSASDVNSQDIRFSLGIGAAALESNVPSRDAISTLIDSDGNTHFYIYDAKPSGTTVSNWDKAYDYAKTLKLFGMKGYLATITSATEDAVMDALTTEGGWAGAICDTITTKDADTAAGLGQSGTTAARKVKTNWQWVCGPEAGTALFKTAGSVADGQYDGWKSTGEPNGYSLGSEWCLDLHFGGHWNDYPSSNTAGAFVEFSPYPTSTALSFDKTVPCGNWNDWSQTVAANFATYGTASRTAKNGSKTETWDTIPYLPQPDANSLNSKIGDFWTESAYTAPTSSSSGSVTYTASGTRSSVSDELESAYSFSIQKTLMPLAQTNTDSTTLLTGLTAGQAYQVTLTDGSVIAVSADSNGAFNFGTYTDPTYGSLLGKTFKSMVMVDSSGTAISETQTLPSTLIRKQYDVPVVTLNYGDNDVVTVSGLVTGHTYTVDQQTYVADSAGSITLSGVISDSASVMLGIVDTSVDATRYISSYEASFTLLAREAAPDVSAYGVTEATTDSEKATVAVPSGSEYYDETTKAWIKGQANVSVTPGQSLKVRVSATGTKPASNIASVPTKVYQQATPSATIDYLSGCFKNLLANATYIIDKKEYTSDANGDLEIAIPLYGHTFSAVLKHTHSDGSDSDSEAQTLTAIAMPSAPDASGYPVTAATSASDKAEVSVPSGSEYYDETTKAWIKGPVSVEVTPGASLQVRTSASSTTPFSETTTG